MNLTLGTTLKNAEKHFGPCLPGMADPATTVSAGRYAGEGGKNFAGVPGIHSGAVFYVHFPVPVHLASITSKKGTIDFIKDMKQDGPQAKQGREAEVETFLHERRQKEEAAVRKEHASVLKKEAAARKKEEDTRRKEAAQKKAQMVEWLCSSKQIIIEIRGKRFEVDATITFAKSTQKVKVVAQFQFDPLQFSGSGF